MGSQLVYTPNVQNILWTQKAFYTNSCLGTLGITVYIVTHQDTFYYANIETNIKMIYVWN